MSVATYTKDPDAIKKYSIRWGAPNWAGSNPYKKDDVVLDVDGCYYIAKVAHTSDPTLRANDFAKWHNLIPSLWMEDDGGELIDTSAWVVTPAGELTVDSSSISGDEKVATVVLSGGVADKEYTVRNRIVTKGLAVAQTDDRSLTIKVEEQ
jgi:hypothetical protein